MTDQSQTTEPGMNCPIVLLRVGEKVRVLYRNWRVETAIRNIELDGAPFWACTQWHPEPQWLIAGTDIDSGEHRMWAVKDMEPVSGK